MDEKPPTVNVNVTVEQKHPYLSFFVCFIFAGLIVSTFKYPLG